MRRSRENLARANLSSLDTSGAELVYTPQRGTSAGHRPAGELRNPPQPGVTAASSTPLLQSVAA